MFEKRKARRAAEAAAKAEQARAEQAAEHERERGVYAWALDRTRSIAEGTFADATTTIALHRGERAVYALDDVGLVESRRGPGHWQGGSQGVSVRVPGTKSMRYRVGQTRGTYVAGADKPTVIDRGTFTITTTRAVFVGAQQNREWPWAKLLAFHDDEPGWIGIAVSNRQKVSGVTVPAAEATALHVALHAAAAAANGTAAELSRQLELQAQSL